MGDDRYLGIVGGWFARTPEVADSTFAGAGTEKHVQYRHMYSTDSEKRAPGVNSVVVLLTQKHKGASFFFLPHMFPGWGEPLASTRTTVLLPTDYVPSSPHPQTQFEMKKAKTGKGRNGMGRAGITAVITPKGQNQGILHPFPPTVRNFTCRYVGTILSAFFVPSMMVECNPRRVDPWARPIRWKLFANAKVESFSKLNFLVLPVRSRV